MYPSLSNVRIPPVWAIRKALREAAAVVLTTGNCLFDGALPVRHDHSLLGEKDEAFALLENARANRDQFLVILKVDSSLDNPRNDPRFQDLLRHVGFASL